MIDRLVNLQQIQLDFMEEFCKLQTRVVMEFLPENFDELEYFIAPDLYIPFVKDDISVEFKQKRYKMIQEAKRLWLNMYIIDAYELILLAYKQHYQQILKQFEINNLNHPHMNGITLVDAFITYMDHRINRMKQEIYYEKILDYRRQLTRLRRRSTSTKQMVKVSPQVILDLIHHPFTAIQLSYLSRGKMFLFVFLISY
jgi:hypothetical protein